MREDEDVLNEIFKAAAIEWADQELSRQIRGTSPIENPAGILNCPDLTPEEMEFIDKREVQL